MPTFAHGKNVNVFINEYDFSTYFNDVSATSTVETAEVSAFGSSAKEYIVGLLDGTVSLSGMFDGTATGTDVVFSAVLGSTTKQNVIVAPSGHSNGATAIVLEADDTSYEVSGAIADVVQTSAEFQSSDGVEHGKILSSGAAVSATGSGTSVDNAASSANGGVGFVSVPTNTRNGNITVKVQQSADDSTFTDLITFTVVTSTQKTFERVEVTGTVARYLRVNYTVAGSTGSATPVVAFARRN
ncbi:major tail protein 2 [Freshwater phage uvFW-CGR-AMD-COM-C203]|nr:major tail protein 2 [Freshwater phage uvFW-CGR-AMD-COM-C203]